jgi:hypothetical protein
MFWCWGLTQGLCMLCICSVIEFHPQPYVWLGIKPMLGKCTTNVDTPSASYAWFFVEGGVLRHLFQYQRVDQFILAPQNFNSLICGKFLTWYHKVLLKGERSPSPFLTLLL